MSEPTGTPQKNWFSRHKILTAIGIVVVLAIIGSIASGGGKGKSSDGEAATASSNAPEGSSEAASVQASAPDEAEPVESVTSESEPATETSSASSDTEAAAPEPGIGDAVRDGKFEIVVKKMTCGEKQVGDEVFGKKAQGQFCLVDLSVKNIGKKAQTFFGSNQKVFDDQGREFDADDEAAIYLPDSNALMEKINPGNKISGTVIFDVPKKVTPTAIELHDSLFSGGVRVDLK